MFKIKECFNKSTESNFSEVTPNDIKKEIKILDSFKKVHLKILLQNLSIKGKIYARHYEIHRRKKLHKKGFFQRITPVFLEKQNFFS